MGLGKVDKRRIKFSKEDAVSALCGVPLFWSNEFIKFHGISKKQKAHNTLDVTGFLLDVPRGIRTPVASVKGRCPGPG